MSRWKPDPAVRIALLYAVFGCLWILVSDRLVAWFVADPVTASRVQTVKGWAFVLVSAAVVYGLVRREQGRREAARQRLETARSLHERVLAGISDAVLVIDVEHRTIVDCNRAAVEMFGYGREELVDASTAIVHANREQYERFAAEGDPVLARGEPFRTEWKLQRQDGEIFHTEQVVSLLTDGRTGEAEYAVSVVRDVSSRVEYESKLEESHRRLQESRDLLRRYAEHLTRAREQERTDIAREMHDELGQALTGLKMQLARVRRRLAGGEQVAAADLDPSIDLVHETVDRVRELSSSLRPTALDQLGLREGLEWLTEQFADRSGIEVSYEVGRVDLDLGAEASTHVYRVVQEALTNVARHAEADRARVVVDDEEDVLVVRVLDDGVGLGGASIRSLHSHGLLGMQERAHLVGGELDVRDRVEGGTEVRLRVPRSEGRVA